MGSFDCPHKNIDQDSCYRLGGECNPGREGCVLEGANFLSLEEEGSGRENSAKDNDERNSKDNRS